MRTNQELAEDLKNGLITQEEHDETVALYKKAAIMRRANIKYYPSSYEVTREQQK